MSISFSLLSSCLKFFRIFLNFFTISLVFCTIGAFHTKSQSVKHPVKSSAPVIKVAIQFASLEKKKERKRREKTKQPKIPDTEEV